MKKISILSCFLLVCLQAWAFLPARKDSTLVRKLQKDALVLLSQKHYTQATFLADSALRLAHRTSFAYLQADIYATLGRCYHDQNFDEALINYLQAVRVYDRLAHSSGLANCYENLANLYFEKKQAYEQALNYYQKSLNLKENNRWKISASFLVNMASANWQLGEAEKALIFYQKALETNEIKENKAQKQAILKQKALLYIRLAKHNEVVRTYQELAFELEQDNNFVELADVYNSLGYLFEEHQEAEEAMRYFEKAIKLLEQAQDLKDSPKKAIFLENIGIAYSQKRLFKNAKEVFEQAFKIKEKYNNALELAQSYNHLGAVRYLTSNTIEALSFAQKAENLAEKNHAYSILATSCKLLELIYEKEQNFQKANYYAVKYQAALDRSKENESLSQQNRSEKQADIVRNEETIKRQIAIGEQQEQERLKFLQEKEALEKDKEIDRQKSALDLAEKKRLQSDLENQRLAQAQLQQMLLVNEQRLALAQKEKSISLLKEQETQKELELRKKEAEQTIRKKAIETLEKEQKIQQEALVKEQKSNRLILILSVSVICLMLVGLVFVLLSRSRHKQKNVAIQKQQQEILSQNEELIQNQEEIISQRNFIEDKNKQLGESNRKLSESIHAASVIQKAILPVRERRFELLPPHFVLYFPRDVVSGDFYWINNIGDMVFVAVVDCTGHGVPGAFMSMIGNTILNKVILMSQLTDPAQIMEEVDKSTKEVLQQRERGGDVSNGMDICLCRFEKKENTTLALFTGAKRPLFVYRFETKEMIEIKGDRRSIADKERKDKLFTNTEILLQENDCVYLTTDGFVDQPNKENEKYGTKRFKELIQNNGHLPIEKQKRIFKNALMRHQETTEQRDDITLIAIQIV